LRLRAPARPRRFAAEICFASIESLADDTDDPPPLRRNISVSSCGRREPEAAATGRPRGRAPGVRATLVEEVEVLDDDDDDSDGVRRGDGEVRVHDGGIVMRA